MGFVSSRAEDRPFQGIQAIWLAGPQSVPICNLSAAKTAARVAFVDATVGLLGCAALSNNVGRCVLHLSSRGLSLSEAGKLMGHTQPSTTWRYMHADKQTRKTRR